MNKEPNKLLFEVIYNIAFSLIGAATLVWTIRYASIVFTSIALGVFLFSRRFGSTLANFLQLGLSKSLTRYVSIDLTNKEKKMQYVVISILIWLIVGFLIVNMFFLFRTKLADLVFPNLEKNIDVLFWTIIFSWSLVLNYFIRSTFIADRKIILANIIETINASGFLVISLLFFSGSENVIPVLRIHALSIILFSLFVLVFYIISLGKSIKTSFQDILQIGKKLLSFGFPRAMISTLDMLILLIGPWLIRDRVDQSGYLIIALSVLRIIQTMIKPVMEITSSITARYIGANKLKHLKTGMDSYFQIVLYFSIMATVLLILWSDFLISIWLQDPGVVLGVGKGLTILIWALVPFTIFHSMKGIVEMNWTTPYNLITLTIGVIVQISAFFILRVYYSEETVINFSILISYFVIATLTVIWLKPTINKKVLIDLFIFLVLSAVLVFTNHILTINPNLAKMFISFGLCSLIYYVYFRFFPSSISSIIRNTLSNGKK